MQRQGNTARSLGSRSWFTVSGTELCVLGPGTGRGEPDHGNLEARLGLWAGSGSFGKHRRVLCRAVMGSGVCFRKITHWLAVWMVDQRQQAGMQKLLQGLPWSPGRDLKVAEICESQAGMVEGLQKGKNGSQAWVDGNRPGTGKGAARMGV